MSDEVKVDLATYKKEDFKRVSWDEYAITMNKLYDKVKAYVKENNVRLDAIVPIFRAGSFPGTYLAYKLRMLRILPVQFKYFVKSEGEYTHKQLLDLPKVELPDKPNFLLVENNHCFGTTAIAAAKYLKGLYPECFIVYAAAHRDFSSKNDLVFDVMFEGKLTNECKTLDEDKCRELGLANCLYLFPWEDIEEEFSAVSGKPFDYRDLKSFSE